MESILLNIDLAKAKFEIDATVSAYTEMGRALQSSFMLSSEGIKDLKASVQSGKSSTNFKLDTRSVKSVAASTEAAKRSAAKNKGAKDALNRVDMAAYFKGDVENPGSSGVGTGAEAQKMEVLRSQFGVSKKQTLKSLDATYKHSSGVTKFLAGSVLGIRKLVSVFLKSIGKVLGKLSGGPATGFIGGLIGAMTLGYTEMDRRRAEMGEMRNVFMGGVDSIFSSGTKKAVSTFGEWAERAQWQWGVGRKEVQGTIAVMVDNGVSVNEMVKGFDKGLGMVGKNVVQFSIGLAKHFNYSTEDSVGYIMSLVREYGMETREAAKLIERVSYAGVRSGIGVKRFTDIVMKSADPLSRMGVNAEEIGATVSNVILYLQSQGLTSQYAGEQAGQIVSDLMTAFSNINDQFKVALMRDMYPEDEDAGAATLLVSFKDGLQRKSGPSDAFIQRLVTSYYGMMSQQVHGRSEQVMAISESLGVKNRTAAILVDMGKEFANGAKLEEMSEESRKELRNAFNTERRAVSDLHKTKRDLILHTGHLGRSIMAILVDVVGLLTVGSTALKVLFLDDDQVKDRAFDHINDMMDKYTSTLGDHMEAAGVHFKNILKVAGTEFEDTFAPVAVILRDASFAKRKKALSEKAFAQSAVNVAKRMSAKSKKASKRSKSSRKKSQDPPIDEALNAANPGGSRRSGTNNNDSSNIDARPAAKGVRSRSSEDPQVGNEGGSFRRRKRAKRRGGSGVVDPPVKVVGLDAAIETSGRLAEENSIPRK